jgi:hypothetical protein
MTGLKGSGLMIQRIVIKSEHVYTISKELVGFATIIHEDYTIR